ncbi:MAG: glycosyltransferase family 2 protein [Alphaproteobacteria bacterium]|nr:glycosyltransferase family 2 protein [Alphaproteobacteria bacterium]
MTPKISVIIPCYNVENFLKECLDSVFKQTFQDFEVICIDDCSSDKTKEILEQYVHNIQVIHNPENKGQAESRNIGINQAKGDFIYFLDSDDTISENCLEILYSKMLEDNSDMVMGAIQAYPQNSQDLFCVNHSNHLNDWLFFPSFAKKKITPENVLECYHKLHCCPVNNLYKKSFLLNNDIYFIHQKCFHEDNGFWFKILACNPIISGIDEKTYFYRVRNGSTSDKMESDKKAHEKNLKLSLEDALTFVKKRKHMELSDFIYQEIHSKGRRHWLSFRWSKNEKYLTVFLIPIFRLKFSVKKQRGTLKIMGIPFYKWRKKNG